MKEPSADDDGTMDYFLREKEKRVESFTYTWIRDFAQLERR